MRRISLGGCSHSFHIFIVFSLADDGEDNDDLKHTENGKNGNSESERSRAEYGGDDAMDTETNYEDGKNDAEDLLFLEM